MRDFHPLFRNPHFQTVLGNFWPRKFDFSRFPESRRYVQTDADTQVLVVTNAPVLSPGAEARGEVVLVHGLEGDCTSGYMLTLAWTLLNAGFIAHRFNIRTCGGTATLARTLYHAGLTSDLRFFLELRHKEAPELPRFIAGFSLGGNMALKLVGELGETDIIDGACGISTPLDLAVGVRRLAKFDNRLYERRFVKRMRKRLAATGRYGLADLMKMRTIYEIDNRITAPSFGFESADHYYATQSSQNYLAAIRVPTLLIQSKDDTYIPFASYSHPALAANSHIRLAITEHGGHLGFLNRSGYRFWIDEAVAGFISEVVTAAQTPKSQPHGQAGSAVPEPAAGM